MVATGLSSLAEALPAAAAPVESVDFVVGLLDPCLLIDPAAALPPAAPWSEIIEAGGLVDISSLLGLWERSRVKLLTRALVSD